MKTMMGLMMAFVLAAGVAHAAPPPVQTPAQVTAQAEALKILSIADNAKAADALVATIRRMMADKTGESLKDGLPELVIAVLVKTDLNRALSILPMMMNQLGGTIKLSFFQHLVAAAMVAAGDSSASVVQAVLTGIGPDKPRWTEAVMTVAQDTSMALPPALTQAILTVSPTVLPPAVIPPGASYDGQ